MEHPYRVKPPEEELPDIVGASRRKGALRLLAFGGLFFLGSGFIFMTTVVRFMVYAACFGMVIGLFLIGTAAIFALSGRRSGERE